jgi:TP901 family phage tail tape measure protein
VATQVASLFGTLDLRDNMTPALRTARTSVSDFGRQVSSVGSSITRFGAVTTAALAPVGIALAASVRSAVEFDSAITNIGAVMGSTRAEIDAMGATLLEMGANTRFGPQQVALAMYDIVGGVADATTHMAILEASIITATAGSADLTGTTNALISVMNSYGLSADEAAFASDVLTRTVGMGVGTMDQFASALPQVTGLANSMGIGLEDLAAAAAYLTTQGNSASAATTQLGAMMSALLNPNESMKSALSELGYTTGRTAVEQLGLVGTYHALTDAFGQDAIAPLVGSVEALRGVTALSSDAFGEFSTTFVNGIDGATAAAAAIQMDSPAAQLDLLRSSVQTLGIEIGQGLVPILNDIVAKVRPVIMELLGWINANPELATTIGLVGAALVTLGPAITIIGGGITALGGAMTFLAANPIVALVAGIAALVVWLEGQEGGLVGALSTAAVTARNIANILLVGLVGGLNAASQAATNIANILLVGLVGGLNAASQAATNLVNAGIMFLAGAVDALGGAISTGLGAVQTAFETVFGWIKTNVIDPFVAAIQNVVAVAQGVASAVQTIIGGAQSAISTAQNNANMAGQIAGQLPQQVRQRGLGGVLGVIGGAIRAEFRDSGGPGAAGQPYMIGTGAQPELFVPSSAGQFFPAGSYGGDNITVNVTADVMRAYPNARQYGADLGQGIMQRKRERGFG